MIKTFHMTSTVLKKLTLYANRVKTIMLSCVLNSVNTVMQKVSNATCRAIQFGGLRKCVFEKTFLN